MAAYTPAERARLLASLADLRRAGWSFDRICGQPGWPSRRTLQKWLRGAPHLAPPPLRRPSVRWSRKLAERIGWRLASGESLRELCRDPAMPDRRTLYQWCARRPAFAAEIARARAVAQHPHTGRPSTWCEIAADQVYLDLCRLGSLRAVCALPGRPGVDAVRRWARTRPDFAANLALARALHDDMRFDQRLTAGAFFDSP